MYAVRWEISSLEEMADVWTSVPPDARPSVTEAIHAIEAELRSHPGDIGESRDRQRRVHFIPPVGFVYVVDEPARIVSVLHVWFVRPRWK